MNFDYNEEQQLLADSVRRFLAKDYDFEARRKIVASEAGRSASAWGKRAAARATLAEVGLPGLVVPAEHGGLGGGAVDLMGIMEAFGEALVVEPYLPTLMGGLIVARSPLAGSVLPAVVEGKFRLAFAHAEKGARYDLTAVKTRAQKAGDGWILEGEKAALVGAPMAERLVVSANTADGIALFLTEKQAGRAHRTLDEMRAADLVFNGQK